MILRTRKGALALIPVALALLAPATFAQTTAHAHQPNFIQRHPTMTGFGAGLATHRALKISAQNAKLHHRKLNFAERHPTLAGIGAGTVTRHMIITHTTHTTH